MHKRYYRIHINMNKIYMINNCTSLSLKKSVGKWAAVLNSKTFRITVHYVCSYSNYRYG